MLRCSTCGLEGRGNGVRPSFFASERERQRSAPTSWPMCSSGSLLRGEHDAQVTESVHRGVPGIGIRVLTLPKRSNRISSVTPGVLPPTIHRLSLPSTIKEDANRSSGPNASPIEPSELRRRTRGAGPIRERTAPSAMIAVPTNVGSDVVAVVRRYSPVAS